MFDPVETHKCIHEPTNLSTNLPNEIAAYVFFCTTHRAPPTPGHAKQKTQSCVWSAVGTRLPAEMEYVSVGLIFILTKTWPQLS